MTTSLSVVSTSPAIISPISVKSTSTFAASANNNATIPVGIAVARQRYAADNSNSMCKPTLYKENIATVAAHSSYSSAISCHPSTYVSSISNMGVIREATDCERKTTNEIAAEAHLPPSVVAWSTPSLTLPQAHQHNVASPWHSYTADTQIASGISASCGGFQLARDPISGQIVLIPTGQIGIVLPCDLTKSALMQHNATSTAIGQQQLISTNNSSFSLIQQLASSNVHHDANSNIPHHFSAISSTGSLVIQQISNNAVSSPLIDHINNSSLLISAESAATQSILTSQPQYVSGNTAAAASFLFNTHQVSSSENTTAVFESLTPPSSTPYLTSTTPTTVTTTTSTAAGATVIATTTTTTTAVAAAAAATATTTITTSTITTSTATATASHVENCPPQLSFSISDVCSTAKMTVPENSNPFTATHTSDNDDSNYISKFHAFKKPFASATSGATATDGASVHKDQLATRCAGSADGNDQVVIFVKKNSSMQDAGNQTDTNLSYHEGATEIEENTSADDAGNKLQSREEKLQRAEAKLEHIPASDGPDFSGLQLLLNGIERVEHDRKDAAHTHRLFDSNLQQHENNLQTSKLKHVRPTNEHESDAEAEVEADKSAPRSLDILCALADQRFLEENKNNLRENQINSGENRKFYDMKFQRERERAFDLKCVRNCVRSSNTCNADQREMRMELARLQKKYRETRKKLDRLTMRKKCSSTTPFTTTDYEESDGDNTLRVPVKRGPGRPRKCDNSGINSTVSSKLWPRQRSRPNVKNIFEKCESARSNDLSPPILEPMCSSPQAKLGQNYVRSPPTLLPSKQSSRRNQPYIRTSFGSVLYESEDSFEQEEEEEEEEEHENDDDDDDVHDGDCDVDDDDNKEVENEDNIEVAQKFSNQMSNIFKVTNFYDEKKTCDTYIPEKRKVGRPRKYPKVELDSSQESTPKKSKLTAATLRSATFTADQNSEKTSYFVSSRLTNKRFVAKQIPLTSSVVSSFAMLKSQRKLVEPSGQHFYNECKPKITPKLKAEAKLKTWRQDSPELNEINNETTQSISNIDVFEPSKRHTFGRQTITAATTAATTAADECTKMATSLSSYLNNDDFRITSKLMESVEKHPLRVLISVGGLFRAGELSAVRAPDLYGIKLDGERGQRTHIYTKEEVLRDVVLEVKGKYPLKSGTRVCAFWSSQYLSLYPGLVTSFSSSDESEDDCFTSVEFDDGDSGRINIEDIRLLPVGFSINQHVEERSIGGTQYHGQRKRRLSSLSCEEIPIDKQLVPSLYTEYESCSNSTSRHETENSQVQANSSFANAKELVSASGEEMVERRHSKKKRKDKLRKGGKCNKYGADSNKTHRHHKHKHKHRKHRKRKRTSSSDVDYSPNRDMAVFCTRRHKTSVSCEANIDHDQNVSIRDENHSSAQIGCATVVHFEAGVSGNADRPNTKCVQLIQENRSAEQNRTGEKEAYLSDNIAFETETNDTQNLQRPSNGSLHRSDTNNGPKIKSPSSPSLVVESSSATATVTAATSSKAASEQQDDKQETKKLAENGKSAKRKDSTLSDEDVWKWHGKGFKRNGKGRAKKEFFRSIERGNVIINVGDCAVFLTAGNSAKPFIGRIESMWESCASMMVRVKWFYHPEETSGLKEELPFLGALFESPHNDKNEVQTISHKCEVVSFKEYRERVQKEPDRLHNVYQSNDLYYLAGYYDPTTQRLALEKDVLS